MGSSIPHRACATGWLQEDQDAGGGEAGGGAQDPPMWGLQAFPRNLDLVSKAVGNGRSNTIGLAMFIFIPFYTECISFTIPVITVGKLDFGAKNII